MQLYTVDVGLMADHLPAHEGTMRRLEHYISMRPNVHLMSILQQQLQMMTNHVQAMRILLDPNHAGPINLPPLGQTASTPREPIKII